MSSTPARWWLAATLLVATCATAAVAAHVGRGWLEDSWWIWRLGSGEQEARFRAAEKLAERKCVRAVPQIVRAIANDPAEEIMDSPTPLVRALQRIGRPALPALERYREYYADDLRVCRILKRLLRKAGTSPP